MKKILSIFFITVATTLFSQSSLSIKYNYEYNWKNAPNYTIPSLLKMGDDKSLFIIDHSKNGFNDDELEANNIIQVKSKNNFVTYYKDYNKDSIYYDNTIIFKHFPTKDPIQIFNWELTKQTKTILGFNCQRAVMRHYGRTYHAFFTTELGFTHGGPWKFDGLPGVILEVYSLDNEFKITATEIQLKNEDITIDNPYNETKKFIDFKEYQRLYQKNYKESNKTEIDTEGNTSVRSVSKCQIECLVD